MVSTHWPLNLIILRSIVSDLGLKMFPELWKKIDCIFQIFGRRYALNNPVRPFIKSDRLSKTVHMPRILRIRTCVRSSGSMKAIDTKLSYSAPKLTVKRISVTTKRMYWLISRTNRTLVLRKNPVCCPTKLYAHVLKRMLWHWKAEWTVMMRIWTVGLE